MLSAVFLMTLIGCEKSLSVEGAAEGSSVLSVITRSGETDAEVSYPVTVYVMNQEGVCVRKQELASASDQLSLKLQPTTYQVYAIGGAADEAYTLPSIDEATATSPIALKTGETHGDLMAAYNTVTMGENESNTLTLTMSRKVMELRTVQIKGVPSAVTAVSVMFSSIYDNLLLNGNYSEGTSAQTMTLARQADNTTWQNSIEQYMLPANGKPTITVKMTTGETTKSYSYNCPQELEANKHIDITGTYTGGELTLTGVITGATWNGTTTIEFTFNETNAETTDSGTTGDDTGGGSSESGVEDGTAPAVNTLYKDCYVIDSYTDGDYKFVTVIHKNEQEMSGAGATEESLLSDIEAALATYDINGITGWRLPTEAEARKTYPGLINEVIASVGGMTMNASLWYYHSSDSGLKTFKGHTYNNKYTDGQRLRPVTTLKFHK